jgi:small subunit ribosomal protein S18
MRVVTRKKDKKPETCYFDDRDIKPQYREVDTLKLFLTPRGKILSRSKTGITAKNQRLLAEAIKRARELALL